MSDSDVSVRFGASIEDLIAGIEDIKAQLANIETSTKAAGESFGQFGAMLKNSMDTAPIDKTKKAMADLHDAVNASTAGLKVSAAYNLDIAKGANIGADGVAALSKQFEELNSVISHGGAGGSSSWIKAILGGGAIGVAAVGAVELLDKVNGEFLTLERNAKEFGISLQKIQELKYAANLGGVDNEQFTSGLQEAAKKLNDLTHDAGDLGKFLDANNVKWKDASGHIVSMNSYIEIAARLIQNAATEGDKFKASEMLGFSRSWVEALERGPIALRQSATEAHAVGAVLEDELVKRAADMEREWNATSLRWSTYFKSMIVSITPYVADLVNGLTKMGSDLADHFKQRLAEGDFGARFAAARTSIESAATSSEQFGDHLLSAAGSATRIGDAFAAFKGDLAGVSGMIRPFVVSSNQADGLWKNIAAEAEKTAAMVAKAAEGATATTKFPGKDDKDDTAGKARMIDADIGDEQAALAAKKAIFAAEADAYRITQQQKAVYTEAAIEYAQMAEMALVQDKQKLYEEGTVGYGNAEREKVRLTAENQKAMLATVVASQREMQQEVTRDLNMFVSAFNSQFTGLINRTETWRQAMAKIGEQLFMDLIKRAQQWAVEHIAVLISDSLVSKTQGASDVVAHASAEAAKTEATLAGVAARSQAEIAGMTASLPARAGNFASTIIADAAATFAGIFANLAPLMGPAAAGPAAVGQATVLAQLGNIPKLDIGGYVLSSGLAMIHQGETVVPAQVQSPGGGGGGNTVNVTFSVSALDANGTQAFFNSNGRQIASVLSGHLNAPSLQGS